MTLAELHPLWTTFLQPAAIAVGAALAYWGVRRTIEGNHDRLFSERLEARARDRLEALQKGYADFAGATALFCSSIERYVMLKKQERAVFSPPPPGVTDGPTADAIRERYMLSEAETVRAMHEACDALTSTYTRLLLIDNHAGRLHILKHLHGLWIGLRDSEDIATVRRYRDDVLAFVERVAPDVQGEYREDAMLAKEGKYPPEVRGEQAA